LTLARDAPQRHDCHPAFKAEGILDGSPRTVNPGTVSSVASGILCLWCSLPLVFFVALFVFFFVLFYSFYSFFFPLPPIRAIRPAPRRGRARGANESHANGRLLDHCAVRLHPHPCRRWKPAARRAARHSIGSPESHPAYKFLLRLPRPQVVRAPPLVFPPTPSPESTSYHFRASDYTRHSLSYTRRSELYRTLSELRSFQAIPATPRHFPRAISDPPELYQTLPSYIRSSRAIPDTPRAEEFLNSTSHSPSCTRHSPSYITSYIRLSPSYISPSPSYHTLQLHPNMSPGYPAYQSNSSRHSAGSFHRPPRRYTGPPSPSDSWLSKDSSIPLSTPWSTPPTSSASSLSSGRRHHRSSSTTNHPGPRRSSKHRSQPQAPAPHPEPVVIQTKGRGIRNPSPESHATTGAIIIPASSTRRHRTESRYPAYSISTRSTSRPQRDPSVARSSSRPRRDPSVARSSRHRSSSSTDTSSSNRPRPSHYNAPSKPRYDIKIIEDLSTGRKLPHHGRTRFPESLVSRDAVEELGYPFAVEESGGITVLQALDQPDIDRLVELTQEIERHPPRKEKAVSFYEKTIVHDVPPAPTPPPSNSEISTLPPTRRPRKPLTAENIHVFESFNGAPGGVRARRSSARSSANYHVPSSLHSTSYRLEPLSPPAPSAPKHPGKTLELDFAPRLPGTKTHEEKVKRAEEKAAKARAVAGKKAERARTTGRKSDEVDAVKARERAEKLQEKVLDKMSEKDEKKIRGTVRVGRNRNGEIVIIKS